MSEEIVKISGPEKGVTSVILAGVHGNEKCGAEAFSRLLPGLKIDAGEVIFLFGNPKAMIQNQRYVEANLNRLFKPVPELSIQDIKSYEFSRAEFIKKYLNQASALLDIHASTSEKSKPFIICEKNAQSIVKYLPIDTIVTGFDEVEPGGTDYYMNTNGKIGICVECGYLGDDKSTDVAIDCIESFLLAREHSRGDKRIYTQSWSKIYQLYYVKGKDYRLYSELPDFCEIPNGTTIGFDNAEAIKVYKDSFVLFAQAKCEVGAEAFLLGEKINGPT